MILRICVVIPVFDNPRTISRVTREVVTHLPFPILLIDDGSEIPVTNVLYSFEVKEAMEKGRARVVRFERTLGKGAALRYAMRDLAAAGFTHMLTLDGDGSLGGSELRKLTDEALRHPWDLILGRRRVVDPEPASWWSRVTSRALEACVNVETGARIEDPRSGVRVYPLFPLQRLRWRTTRHDFDLEVLIRALWNGVAVREVDVVVTTPAPADRATSPRRRGDSLRLSILNVGLLAVTLLRTNSRPRSLGLAVGVGVFIGCTPLIGLHAGLAVAVALVLRLNVIAVLLGSRVSTPLLMPLLILASLHIGQHWLKIPLAAGRWSHVYRLTAGSLVLGTLLGLAFGWVTYYFARAAQTKRPVTDAGGGGRRLIERFARLAGPRGAALWASVAATYYVAWSQVVRRGLGEYYGILAPRLTWVERFVRRWRHVRRVLLLRADATLRPPVRFSAEGEPRLPTDGIELIGAHLGDWTNAVANLGARPIHTPDRPGPNPRFEIIPFLGALAVFDVEPFARAARDGTKLAVVFAPREDDGYVIHVRAARAPAPPAGDQSVALQIYEWASRFVVRLEFMVKRYPDQWTTLYPFWSTIPTGARDDRADHALIEDLPSLPRLRPQRG